MDVDLVSYVDADFAGAIGGRHSVSGYVYFLTGFPISWQSFPQHTVALSFMGAENITTYIATHDAF